MADKKASTFRRYRSALVLGVLVILLGFAQFWSWPYVIYGPGSAESVHDRVETGRELDEKGAFLFTTVSTYSEPNAFSLAYAWLNPKMDIQTQARATGGTTNLSAYRNLLAWMRDNSEATALLAAYGAINRPIEVRQKGVIIARFLKESKAVESGLQEGDIITAVDGKPTLRTEDLIRELTSRKPGDTVKLTGTRGKQPLEVTVPLIKMPETGVTGIGFQHNSVIEVTPPDPVKFDFDDVGGPSAGLMMTLEIVAQLTGEDLTRGYRIAGTGTIDGNGAVGQIGGIAYKLMAAEQEKADYFLVPYVKDAGYSNWKEAEETVRKQKLKLKLVPVATLSEALAFVRTLEEKAAS